MEKVENLLSSRLILYRFFSRVFERELSQGQIESLINDIRRVDSSGIMNTELKGGIENLKAFLDEINCHTIDKVRLRLAVEYADLFLGVKGLPHPSESSYLSGDNLIWQEWAEKIFYDYLDACFVKSNTFPEPPDHIAIQLQFMALLCQRQINALRENKAEEFLESLKLQKSFLEGHLLRWIPQMVEIITKYDGSGFYKSIAEILNGFLEIDKCILEAMSGLDNPPENMVNDILTLATILKSDANFNDNQELLKEVSREAAERLKNELQQVRIHYVVTNNGGFTLADLPNEVHVRGGRIIRIKPIHFDEKHCFKIRAKGKIFTRPAKTLPAPYEVAYKLRCYSPNRVRYPLKRVDWDPNGERNPQNRGKSGYVRITWDEALDIIANEIQRVIKQYGSYAIAIMADGHGQSTWQTLHTYAHLIGDALGGCIHIQRNPDSWEGYYWGAKHVWGMDRERGYPPQVGMFDEVLENTELAIFAGADPETTSWGFWGQVGSISMRWFKEAGIKCIFICPDANYSAVLHADKWIPIRPGTDAALYLAIAYVWITDGTYDREFLEKYTYGFEEFKRYVLGEEDGVPKTPDWASKITGIPARIIRALAKEWARRRTSIVIHYGGPKIRSPYAHEACRLETILLAMQGSGKRPGVHLVRAIAESAGGIPLTGDMRSLAEFFGLKEIKERVTLTFSIPANPYMAYFLVPLHPCLPKTLLPDAILNPPIMWYGTGAIDAPRIDQFVKYQYPEPGKPEIHMLIDENACWFTCWNEGYRMVEALRSPKIEFYLVIHPWFENTCAFADIILPASTVFEQDDIAVRHRYTAQPPSTIVWIDRCIEPIGESKSDYEIVRLILNRLGIELLPPFEQFAREHYETSDLVKVMTWEEFKRRKIIWLPTPTPEEWEEIKRRHMIKPGLCSFVEDPKENPLATPTGLLEIYSKGLAEHFPDDEERPPVPRYIPYGDSHKESLFHPRAKKYPLLLVSNHPRWRTHANNDDLPWLREIPTCKVIGPDGYLYEPLWIHPIDAEKRGIKMGDVVKVYNERGMVLCGAYVTERIMPGVVYVDHGARVDFISLEDKIDRGGAINLICPRKPISKNTVGMTVSGYLVEVEKVDLEDLKRKYPKAFTRTYDPAWGYPPYGLY